MPEKERKTGEEENKLGKDPLKAKETKVGLSHGTLLPACGSGKIRFQPLGRVTDKIGRLIRSFSGFSFFMLLNSYH